MSPKWSVAKVKTLPASVIVVDVGATRKRPAGVRGMTVVEESVHLVVGQTERGLTAKKVKAAPARHVRVDDPDSDHSGVAVMEEFVGFRKVEGVARGPEGGWLYALDDEDSVVLVLSSDP